MAKINKKIMAFVGTEDASRLVSALAEYTDDIYAAVSDEYGKAPHPGGNITIISKYLDEEKMESWINRIGIDIVIDGTALSVPAERAIIKKLCERKGIEYYRIAARQQMNMHASIMRSSRQLIRELEYTVGNVLAEGDAELYDILTDVKNFSEKVFIIAPAEPEILKAVLDRGYRKENILSFNRIIHADLLKALFREFKISDYVFPGYLREGIPERLAAVDSSEAKAAIWGDLLPDDGMEPDDIWDMFSERFDL